MASGGRLACFACDSTVIRGRRWTSAAAIGRGRHSQENREPMKVEIYSDVACPWCYIGKARFERALDDFSGAEDVEMIYRPYQLDPGAPHQAVPMLEYLERRFGANARKMADRVTENARSEGLVMDYDRGLAVNTLNAHRLLWLAEVEHGPDVQRAVAERLFEAHFAEGRNIGDADVLAEIAEEEGISAARVREHLASDEGVQEVRQEIAHAQRLGITAVPTFVFDGRYAVQGAQPTPAFLQALQTVAHKADGDGVD
jgi:predicted DsbA family dithiol-disulfide isomerase